MNSINKKPKNILDLTSEEKQTFLNSFDIFLTDCDDVLWNLFSPIEGTGEVIQLLKSWGKVCGYVSNNTLKTEEEYEISFQKAGIEYNQDDLTHPCKAIISYLNKVNFSGLIYCLAPIIFINALRQAGYEVISGPDVFPSDQLSELIKVIKEENEPVAAVIMDIDINISGVKLQRAQNYLNKNPNCLFLAGLTDKFYGVHGTKYIAPGSFTNLVTESTGKSPIVLGKPGIELGKMLREKYNIVDPKRTIMVGDSLEQDIGFGKVCGFQTLAVLTGGCKLEDFNNSKYSDLMPDYYATSLVDFVKFFEQISNVKV